MNLPTNSYNPSLLRYQGKWLSTVRAHTRGDWRTEIFMAELDDAFRVTSCTKIEPPLTLHENSQEDGRLWTWNNELWLSWTISQFPTADFRCAVCFGQLLHEDGKWKVGRYYFPKYGRNDFTALEKNWAPFQIQNHLWCYYVTKDDEQVFIRLDGANVVEAVRSKSLPWAYGPIHGGSICALPNGNLLHAFNSRTGQLAIDTHRYHIGVAELSPNPPFEVMRISQRPILSGEEGVNTERARFFKSSVKFCCGAAWHENRLLVAHGWNDCKARIAKLKMEELNL